MYWSFHWIPIRVKAEYSSSILATMKSPHTSLLSLETQHGLADMVASGKTHNIIGTKLWNMQYGGWLLYFVPGRVLWSESVHRGTFDFCSCVRDSMLTGSLLWADWAAGGAASTQRWGCFELMWSLTGSPVWDHHGATKWPEHQVRGRGLKGMRHIYYPGQRHSVIWLFSGWRVKSKVFQRQC